MLGRIIGLVLVAMAVGAAASAQDVKLPAIDFGRYHALVIGSNDYRYLPKLETAVNDATAAAALLRERYGFEVSLLVDATRSQILDALNGYRRDLTERDNLLIYYAGHGVLDEETDTGFWLPVDAKPDSDTDWIANADLTRRLRAISAKHVLVVADSCYSGALLREATAALPIGAERAAWLQRMSRIRSRTALVSGGLEPVVDSGGGEHSVFAKAFLEALGSNTEVLEGQALFTMVRRPVVLNADQTPRYSDIRLAGHEGGEFLFVPVSAAPVAAGAAVPRPVPSREAVELVFWKSVESSRTASDFEAYLRRFPNGNFAALARNRLRQLAALAAPPKLQVEPLDAEFVALRNANVRAAPTAESRRLGVLAVDTRVTVTGKVKGADWYRIARAGAAAGYVFAPLLGEAVAPPAPARPPAPAVDEAQVAFWNAIKDSDNPGDFQAYLRKYPDGLFKELSQLRLSAALEAATASERARQADAGRRAEEEARQAALEQAARLHREQFPNDGRYIGKLTRTWLANPTLGGQCRGGDLELEVRDGRISGGVNVHVDQIPNKALKKVRFRVVIHGRINQAGVTEGVKAQVYMLGLNFMTLRFQGTVTRGTWVDVMKQCRGEYRVTRVGD